MLSESEKQLFGLAEHKTFCWKPIAGLQGDKVCELQTVTMRAASEGQNAK